MEKTLKQFLSERQASGADAAQTAKYFQETYGFPITQADMDSPWNKPSKRKLFPKMEPIPEFPTEKMGQVVDEHTGTLERLWKNLGVALPSTLVGTAAGLAAIHPVSQIEDPEEFKKHVEKVKETYKNTSENLAKRYKEEGFTGSAISGLGETIRGFAHLLEAPFTSPVGTVQGEFEKGFQRGTQLPSQMVGATAATLANPEKDPINAAIIAAPAIGAAKAGAKAAALSTAAKGGTLGRAAGAVARGIEAAESIHPLQGVMDWAAKHGGIPQSIEQAAKTIDDMVQIGALTAEKAAELKKNLSPFQAVAMEYGASPSSASVLEKIGKVAKKAAIGELLMGGTLPAGVGALAGAGLDIGGELVKAARPSVVAAVKRHVQSPFAQETAGQEQAVRSVAKAGARGKSALRASAQQLASEVREGGIELQQRPEGLEAGEPSGFREAKTETYYSPIRAVTEEGHLKPINLEEGQALSEHARELEQTSRYLDTIRKSITDGLDVTSPLWTTIDADVSRLNSSLSMLEKAQKQFPFFSEKIKSVKGLLEKAIKERDTATLKTTLKQAQDAMQEELKALGGGRVFERDVAEETEQAGLLSNAKRKLEEAVQDQKRGYPNQQMAQAAVDRAQAEVDALSQAEPAKTPRAIPGVTDIHRGVEMASGGARVTPRGVQITETTSPAFESLLEDIHKTVNEGRLPNEQIPRDWTDRLLTNVFSEEGQGGLGALHSERVRGLVVDSLVKEMGLSGKAAKNFNKNFNSHVNEMLGKFYKDNPEGLILELPNGKRVNVAERVREALAGDPKFRAELLADAQKTIVETIADQTHAKHTADAFVRELTQDIPEVATGKGGQVASKVQTLQGYAARLADRLSQGGSIPIMVPFNPKEVAAHLRELLSKYPESSEIKATIDALEKFEPATGDVQSFIRNQEISHPGTGVWLSPGAQSSLDPFLKMANTTHEVRGLMDWLSTRFRSGPTKYNVAGAKNNMVSNAFLDSLFRGVSPLQSAAETIKATRGYRAFLNNESTGFDKLKWQSAVNNNLPALTRLEEHVGQVRGATRVGKHRSAADIARSLGEAIDSGASTFYQMGDLGPKLSVFSDGFDIAANKIKKMEPGTYAIFDAPHGDSIRIDSLGNNKYKINGKVVDFESQEMADAIGKHAVKNSTDFFVDPTEAPLWAQRGRASKSLVVSTLTAFPTWAWHMMDIPGLKEGVLSRLLKSGTGVIRSNSPAILADNMEQLFALAARRLAVTETAKLGTADQNRTLNKLAGTHGNLTTRLEPGQQPDVVNISNYAKYDPFKLTSQMAQFARLLGTYVQSERLKGKVKDQTTADQWADRFGGMEIGIRDVPEMLGIGGNMASQLMFDVRNGVKTGSDALRDFTFAIMGVTPSTAARLAWERATGKFIDNQSVQDAGERELGSYMLGELFNIGSKPYLMIGDKGLVERRIDNISKNLNRAFIKPIEDQMTSFNRQEMAGRKIDPSERMKLEQQLAETKQWVAEAIGRKRQQYMEEWFKFQDERKKSEER